MITQRIVDGLRGWRPARVRRLPPRQHSRIMSGARREQHGALAALFLSGTPYEMGYQHGILARDLIHGFRRDAYKYVLPQVPGKAWLSQPLLLQHASTYWATVSRESIHEMRGVAHGAGVHPVEVLLSTAIWEIFHAHGCSQFAARTRNPAGRSILHGYNYDLMDPAHALIQPYLAAIFYRPAQGIPFVTVNTAGSVGVNGGMNEAGISVAWDNTYLRDDTLTAGLSRRVVPFIVTLRRVLQYASTLGEAMSTVIGTLPRPLADTVIIASAREQEAAALETAGREYAVRRMNGDGIWSTNCFRTPELAPHDRRGDGSGLAPADRQRRFPRYSAYEELFEAQADQTTPATAAALLRDPYPREKAGILHRPGMLGTTICRHITSWSLIMDPGSGRFWACDTQIPGCQGRFYAFDLRRWQRLPALDIAATGYGAAMRSAQSFLVADYVQSRAELEEARKQDGVSAPSQLMQALLFGLEGLQAQATAALEQVLSRWNGTPAAYLASAWLGSEPPSDIQPIPYPSAIRPLLRFVPAENWEDRAIPERI